MQRRVVICFRLNCAHCHADDARGDEGPDLHDLHRSDARFMRYLRPESEAKCPLSARTWATRCSATNRVSADTTPAESQSEIRAKFVAEDSLRRCGPVLLT